MVIIMVNKIFLHHVCIDKVKAFVLMSRYLQGRKLKHFGLCSYCKYYVLWYNY